MDKKNTTIGILFLAIAIGLMFWQNKQVEAYNQEQARAREEQRAQMIAEANELQQAAPVAQTVAPAPQAEISSPKAVPVVEADAPEQRPVLENDFFRVEFTSHGGAIANVAFKNYPAVQGEDEPYVFNKEGKAPALAIDEWVDGQLYAQKAAYLVEELSDSKIVFVRSAGNGVTIRRSYEISFVSEGPATYTIKHTISVINDGSGVHMGGELFVDLGTSAPDASDAYGYSLVSGYYNGESFINERPSAFSGGGFFSSKEPKPFIRKDDYILWATTKNPFFASIVTPASPAKAVVMRAMTLPPTPEGKARLGMTNAIVFEQPHLAPGQRSDLTMDCYIGPKEYRRLAELDLHQDRVMQFGWSKPFGTIGRFVGFVGKLFYTGLTAVQEVVVNWGLAIIIMTLIIRLVFWPLTAKAADNSRKMARLQTPLKELREKYKDNPTKLNQETMALFKKYKVNPLAGCLPILIQLPIFIAFYYMLRGASELRFAHFLWINDLSLPDTLASLPDSLALIGGFPINILPLLMGITMFYQMHLAPAPSTDPMQGKIMKLMPLIMLFFCYNFSSGLVLYWTVSNCVSILQQLHTNHKRSLEEAAIAVEEAAKAPVRVADLSKQKGKKRK